MRNSATDYRGQRVLLVGLGLHGGGVATARWLAEQGAKVRVTDIKNSVELAESVKALKGLNITFHLGGYQPSDFKWAQKIVVNPAISPRAPEILAAEKRGVPIENEASIFMREFPGTVVAVTGTRGKTTTTLLLGDILKRAHRDTIVSGNVRQVPMLSHLPKTTASTLAVLELSSYQLERLPVTGHPIHVGLMTNLKVDHVNRHGSLKIYAYTKYNLFRGQTKSDVTVLNWNDRFCRAAVNVGQGKVLWFGVALPKNKNGVTVKNNWIIEQTNNKITKIFPLNIWKLPGQHNLENLLGAVAAARAMKINVQSIKQGVTPFKGVPYRQELIRVYKNHKFINDSASTSPDATLAAISIYPRGVYVLGGTDKDLDVLPLAREIVKKNVNTIFLPGTATVKLQSALRKLKYRQPIVTVHSMSSAVKTALKITKSNQEIILSPGAASFGLFFHEFDRGDKFNSAVKNLL